MYLPNGDYRLMSRLSELVLELKLELLSARCALDYKVDLAFKYASHDNKLSHFPDPTESANPQLILTG